MANRERGEVALRGSDGREYVLIYSLNALVAVEDALGAPLASLQERVSQPSARDLRALIRAGLVERHSEITIEDCGRLFNLAEAAAAVGRAMALAFDTGSGAEGRPADPRPAGAGGSC